MHKQLIILGSGPAGYTASIYAARANLDVLLITGIEKGGQLTTTTDVENWPGDANDLQGPELMNRMHEHAEKFNVDIKLDQISKVELKQQKFSLTGSDEYTCDALIIATGSSAQYLGLPSEKEFLGRGVSACATCDGFFYKDRVVAVVGGGNTAVEEALYLSKIAKKVILIHRRDTLRAEKILQERLFKLEKEGNIEIMWNHILEEVHGNDSGVQSLSIKNVTDNKIANIELEGVFIAIGHKPNTDMFAPFIELKNGYITTKHNSPYATQTTLPGVFAAGDVADPIYRQAITSAGTGCMAALDVEKYLDSK
ncbi:MAG: thioredoxin-disulfide reductase [Gammaproteobacteria bacterium]|nr:thioredoxin-disulfide reductase [Gammaproteobacteria bacterium]